jgi:hypothetical protein
MNLEAISKIKASHEVRNKELGKDPSPEKIKELIKKYYDKGDCCYNLTTKAVSPEGCELKNPEETMKKRSRASKSQWKNNDRREKHIKDMKIYWESDEGKQRLKTISESLKDRWINDEDYKQKSGDCFSSFSAV